MNKYRIMENRYGWCVEGASTKSEANKIVKELMSGREFNDNVIYYIN